MIAWLLITGLVSGAGGEAAIVAPTQDNAWISYALSKRRYEEDQARLAALKQEAERQAEPQIEALPEAAQAPATAELRKIVAAYAPRLPSSDTRAIEQHVSALAAQAVDQWRAEQSRRDEEESVVLLLLAA